MKKTQKLGLAAGAAALLLVGGTTGAVAADLIGTKDIKDNSVRSVDVKDNTLKLADIKDKAEAKLKGAQGPAGPEGPQGPAGPAASDVFGKLAASGSTSGFVTIGKIGGSFSTNATPLFTVDLPEAGTYLLNADGFFDRLNSDEAGYEAPPTDTYLQLTVRGAGNGATCFTGAVSRAGFTEATCSASSVVTVTGPTTLTVRGFGYNEDRSGFGGTPNSATPQFKVAASLSAIRVG